VGISEFVALAVVTENGGAPCGGCRQVLSEFSPKLPIFLCDAKGTILRETSVDELLPFSFGPNDLEE
jgi:cytidine deaminase